MLTFCFLFHRALNFEHFFSNKLVYKMHSLFDTAKDVLNNLLYASNSIAQPSYMFLMICKITISFRKK